MQKAFDSLQAQAVLKTMKQDKIIVTLKRRLESCKVAVERVELANFRSGFGIVDYIYTVPVLFENI